jgi:hypothetical protein
MTYNIKTIFALNAVSDRISYEVIRLLKMGYKSNVAQEKYRIYYQFHNAYIVMFEYGIDNL